MKKLDTKRFDAAIFDFDETMIDLEEQHRETSRLLCEANASDYYALPESFRHSSGMRLLDEVEAMRERFGWLPSIEELMQRRTEIFLQQTRTAELSWLPGVETLIHTLRRRGLRLAIASSGTRSYIEEITERLGLRSQFEAIIAGEEVTRAKPDPEAFEKAARALGVSPERCVVFEDSEVGVGAAKAAGMFCVAVVNPQASFRQRVERADLIVDTLTDLDIS